MIFVPTVQFQRLVESEVTNFGQNPTEMWLYMLGQRECKGGNFVAAHLKGKAQVHLAGQNPIV